MVDAEVCQGEDYSYWMGNWGEAKIAECEKNIGKRVKHTRRLNGEIIEEYGVLDEPSKLNDYRYNNDAVYVYFDNENKRSMCHASNLTLI